MSRIMEMSLESGEKILVEIDPVPGIDRVGRADRVVEAAKDTLEKGLDQIGPVMNAVVKRFKALESPPDKVSLQFGLKVSGELGLVIGKTATEANFTITAEWTPKP